MFFDFACLPQYPRDESEQQRFEAGIQVMPALYASAVGTAVVKLMQVPPRPHSLDGHVLVDVHGQGHIDDDWLVQQFGVYGKVSSADMPKDGGCFALVVFAKQKYAEAAVDDRRQHPSSGPVTHLGYTETPYDQRGWTIFEAAAAVEVLGRCTRHKKASRFLSNIPIAKVYEVATMDAKVPPIIPKPQAPQSPAEVAAQISKATFTARADRKRVLAQYRMYRELVFDVFNEATNRDAALSLSLSDNSTSPRSSRASRRMSEPHPMRRSSGPTVPFTRHSMSDPVNRFSVDLSQSRSSASTFEALQETSEGSERFEPPHVSAYPDAARRANPGQVARGSSRAGCAGAVDAISST